MIRQEKMRCMIKPVVESLPRAVADLTEEALIRVLHVDDDADFLNTAKPNLGNARLVSS